MKFSKHAVKGFYKGLAIYAQQFTDISLFSKEGMSAELCKISDLEEADLSVLYLFATTLLLLVIKNRFFDTDMLIFVYEVMHFHE